MTVQKEIKKYLDEKGIRYAVVARKIGINPAAFTSILNERTKMSIEQFIAICIALEVPASKFIQLPEAI